MNAAVEVGLRRHRMIAAAALAVLAMLAWGWLLSGAGMPAPVDGMEGMDMPPAAPAGLAITFAMWWTMMVAMMLPAAAPTVLLYARSAARPGAPPPSTGAFVGGYLLVWGLFSLLAAAVQIYLGEALILSAAMKFQSTRLAGGVLIAAGAYQLSPAKGACLNHCRDPARFLSRHYRPGPVGALRMGLIHGVWCLGCCWLLMVLLLVGGVMNLAWIAALTLLVAGEKLLPFGRQLSLGVGLAALAAGAWLLVGGQAGMT